VYAALGDRQKAAAALGRAQRALANREYIPAQAIAVAIAAAWTAPPGEAPRPSSAWSTPGAKRRVFGLTPLVSEARLALAEQTDGARRAAGLAGLEKDAKQAGFGVRLPLFPAAVLPV
jgi:hypothetical protein